MRALAGIAFQSLEQRCRVHSGRQREVFATDLVETTGSAFLGLSLSCCRCHDHKFDPIPTADYYAMAGIFRSTETIQGEIQQYVSNLVRVELPIDPENQLRLKIYRLGGLVPLSDVVPVLENFGFRVLQEIPTYLTDAALGSIHEFMMALPAGGEATALTSVLKLVRIVQSTGKKISRATDHAAAL